jgi:hypothetical protein
MTIPGTPLWSPERELSLQIMILQTDRKECGHTGATGISSAAYVARLSNLQEGISLSLSLSLSLSVSLCVSVYVRVHK